jgi:hypothetical protein
MSPKPQLQLRRAPSLVDPARLEAFVSTGVPAADPVPSTPRETPLAGHPLADASPTLRAVEPDPQSEDPTNSHLTEEVARVELSEEEVAPDEDVSATDAPLQPVATQSTSRRTPKVRSGDGKEKTHPIATGIVRRATGRTRRRTTVYLDPTLAKRLVVHSATTDQDISEIAEMAILTYLDKAERR